MFTSIIGQENVIDIFRGEISNGLITNSMLFHGSRYTGKLSTALELVRVLNCQFKASSDCNCNTCLNIRNLDFPGMIYMSRRSNFYEIIEFIRIYKNKKDPVIRDLIFKSIKLSFLPLQDFLIKDVISLSDKKTISKASEVISEIINKNEYSSVDLEKMLEETKNIQTLYKSKNIPVQLMRNILDWSYYSVDVPARVIIIDNVDFLDSSSENILLKRLEEPSKNLFFILLAENKNRIIQTIKSRCRSYFFQDLPKEAVHYIINKKFNDQSNDFTDLESFFHTTDQNSFNSIKITLVKLIRLVFDSHYSFSELILFLDGEKDKQKAIALLEGTLRVLRKEILYRESSFLENSDYQVLRSVRIDYLNALYDHIYIILHRVLVYNLNPKNQLEGIMFGVKEMVMHGKI